MVRPPLNGSPQSRTGLKTLIWVKLHNQGLNQHFLHPIFIKTLCSCTVSALHTSTWLDHCTVSEDLFLNGILFYFFHTSDKSWWLELISCFRSTPHLYCSPDTEQKKLPFGGINYIVRRRDSTGHLAPTRVERQGEKQISLLLSKSIQRESDHGPRAVIIVSKSLVEHVRDSIEWGCNDATSLSVWISVCCVLCSVNICVFAVIYFSNRFVYLTLCLPMKYQDQDQYQGVFGSLFWLVDSWTSCNIRLRINEKIFLLKANKKKHVIVDMYVSNNPPNSWFGLIYNIGATNGFYCYLKIIIIIIFS